MNGSTYWVSRRATKQVDWVNLLGKPEGHQASEWVNLLGKPEGHQAIDWVNLPGICKATGQP